MKTAEDHQAITNHEQVDVNKEGGQAGKQAGRQHLMEPGEVGRSSSYAQSIGKMSRGPGIPPLTHF